MKSSLIARALVSTTALCIPSFALAQEAEDATQSSGLQDIVVTARKTEETIQTVPVAVTALSTESLVKAQVSGVADLQRTAPSLSVATGAPSASGFAFVAIRGQGALNASVSVDPAVAIYVDGVYIPRPSQGQVELTDLSRAEILRGPQGTLFGRNTTGGALNLYTVDPEDEFKVRLKAGYGNYGAWQAGGMVNAPINEEIAFRLNYEYKDRDGYGQNATLDRPVNDLKSHAVRGKLRWADVDSDWQVVLSGDYNNQKDHGQMVGLAAANELSPLGAILPFDPDPTDATPVGPTLASFMNANFAHNKDNWYTTYGSGYSANANIPNPLPYNSVETYGFSATVSGSVGDIGLKSITAYRYSNSKGAIDLDATPIPILATESGYLSKSISQEFQATADITDQFNIISGLYYSYEKGREFSDYQAFGLFKDLLPAAVGYVAQNDADVYNTTFGAYLQGYYKLTEKLRLAAGLRWTWDKRKVKLHNVQVSGAPGDDVYFNSATGAFGPNCLITPDSGDPALCTQTNKVNFNYPAWTFGIDYQATDDLFLYAKTSRASHAGGWNLRANSAPAFRPEELTDVELGFKADMFDRHLRLNVAAFHSWLKDAQRTVSAGIGTPPISTSFIANSGDIQIDGVELEVTAAPWRGMEINANAAFMSGRFDRGTFVDDTGDRSGEPLIQVPSSQFSIGATQSVPLSFGELSIHGDYSYISSQRFYTSPGDTATGDDVANALGNIPGYGLFNGRIAVTLDNPNVELAVWGRNLANKKYLTRSFPDVYSSLGIATEYVGDPRTYGFTLTYNFGGR